MGYEHNASYVIADLARICAGHVRSNRLDEAKHLAKLLRDIADLFPDAAAEVNMRPDPATPSPKFGHDPAVGKGKED